MVSWEASAEVLSELVDDESARDGALVRAAAGIHAASENPIAGQWVYVCPPAWNMTPREFAAACYYSKQTGVSWTDWAGAGGVFGSMALVAATGASGLASFAIFATVVPSSIALPLGTTFRRRMARRNVERMKGAGLQQVLEVSRDDFDGDDMFHADLANADALKPNDLTEVRRRVLKRLWLSAGGDPTVADTMPDKGWVSRSSRKQDGLWFNRAILAIADGAISNFCDHPDEINSPYCQCPTCEASRVDVARGSESEEACSQCESVYHDDSDHDTYRHAIRNRPDQRSSRQGGHGLQQYAYTAQNPESGLGVITGTVEAASEDVVTRSIIASGLSPLTVVPAASASQPEPLAPAAPPAHKPTTMAGRWADALARFEVVEKEWEAIVTDPLAALDHAPLLDMRLMPDGSVSRTGIFLEAFGKAQDLQRRHAAHSPATGPEDRADVVEFEDAARAAAAAWTEAKRWAKHVGINSLPESERDIARRARAALKKAMHEFTPIEEAITAAETAARLLKSIHTVVLPEKAMLQIETKARKAIG